MQTFTRDGIKFTRIHESDAGFMFQFEVYRRQKYLVFQKRKAYGEFLIPNKCSTWNFSFANYEDAFRKFRALKKAKIML